MGKRPDNPNKITLDDLKPGDILLSTGADWLAEAISLIDNTPYSHTTQYIGVENGEHMVVEATRQGILYDSIKLDWDAQTLIDAYRYTSLDHHSFGDPGWPVEPVLEQARSFVGGKYSYSELYLLGVCTLAADIPSNQTMKTLVRLAAGELLHLLEEWLNHNTDKIPMTCVQVATTAHWQATASPAHKYELNVDIETGLGSNTDKAALDAFRELQSKIRKLFEKHHPQVVRSLDARKAAPASKKTDNNNGSFIVPVGSDLVPLGTCGLRELQYSPNLSFVGCLKDTRGK